MWNKGLITTEVVKTVGKDQLSFFVFIFGLLPLGQGERVAKSNNLRSSPSCQMLWWGAKAGYSSSQLPTYHCRWNRLGIAGKSCISGIVVMQSSKLEIPVVGIQSWLTFGTLSVVFEIGSTPLFPGRCYSLLEVWVLGASHQFQF